MCAYKRISPVPVIEGGTGFKTTTAYAPIVGGTTSTGALQTADTGISNSGWVLTSNGSSSLPTFQASAGGGIVTLDGDSGSATGSTVSILSGIPACGSTTSFTGSGSTIQFSQTDANANVSIGALTDISGGTNNTGIGYNVFGTTISGVLATGNCAVGAEILRLATTGTRNNTAIGTQALWSCTSNCDGNVAIGVQAGWQLTSGASRNILIGGATGGNYTSSESDNVCIKSSGVVGEAFILRIGDSTGSSSANQLNKAYICGINGNTLSGTPSMVTIDPTTNQLGVAAIPSGGSVTINCDTGSVSGSTLTMNGAGTVSTSGSGTTITITGTGGGLTWNDVITATATLTANNGYISDDVAAGPVVYTLPLTATIGDTYRIVGGPNSTGGWQIIPNPSVSSQIVAFGNAAMSPVVGSLTSTGQYDAIEFVCIYNDGFGDMIFTVMSSIGNITVV